MSLTEEQQARLDEILARPDRGKQTSRAGIVRALRAVDPTPTQRQLDVLAEIAGGYSNAEIAARLGIEISTVKAHLKTLLPRLEARNRPHAVAQAFRRGLLT